MPGVHHVALCPADLEQSLRFYRDGLGLKVLVDAHLEVDLEPLLGVRTARVRTVFLGGNLTGSLELLDVPELASAQQPAVRGLPRRGLCLLSFQLPVQAALDRLAALGLGGEPRRMATPAGGVAATVIDPDGVTVELLGQALTLR